MVGCLAQFRCSEEGLGPASAECTRLCRYPWEALFFWINGWGKNRVGSRKTNWRGNCGWYVKWMGKKNVGERERCTLLDKEGFLTPCLVTGLELSLSFLGGGRGNAPIHSVVVSVLFPIHSLINMPWSQKKRSVCMCNLCMHKLFICVWVHMYTCAACARGGTKLVSGVFLDFLLHQDRVYLTQSSLPWECWLASLLQRFGLSPSER